MALGYSFATFTPACIDAPETTQKPFGQAAAQQLKKLLPVGQEVTLRAVDTDQYGRTVAEVYKGEVSVNLAMVQQGQAAVYQQYLAGCPDSRNRLLKAEASAKKQQVGFWNQPNPIMPWDFRRSKRSNFSSVTTPPAKCDNPSFVARYPTMASSETSNVGCYMRTEGGRMINLDWMCRGELRYSFGTPFPGNGGSSGYSGGSGGGSGGGSASRSSGSGPVEVKGYYRDGTYVKPHTRSRPDGDPSNNLRP